LDRSEFIRPSLGEHVGRRSRPSRRIFTGKVYNQSFYIRDHPKLDSLGSEGDVCRFSNKAETPESRAWNHFSSTGAGAAWARIPAKRTEETRLENMARDVESGVEVEWWMIRDRCSV
jgi:hypothetical protein